MFQPVSLFIGLRYSRSKKRTGFISFITFFSTVGILLGVASLITVVSVMNGFEGELKKRILGIVPHVVVSQELKDPLDSIYSDDRSLKHCTTNFLPISGVKQGIRDTLLTSYHRI